MKKRNRNNIFFDFCYFVYELLVVMLILTKQAIKILFKKIFK